jgi:23S rRNA (cytosine1962-C5)-methyltransferase
MSQNNQLPKQLTSWIDEQFSISLLNSKYQVRRLFHGRSGVIEAFSALVIDWLPPVAVIRLYDDIEAEVLSQLTRFLASKEAVQGVLVQERGRSRETTFAVAYGEVEQQVIAEEDGLSYQLAPLTNQNSGLFLDMRNGRRWLKAHAQDCKVLNLFSYTCAFSVAAVAGGASLVVNVDLSKRALSIGRTNHQLNQHDKNKAKFMPLDMLKSWSRIKKPGPYDIVVIDPPSFQPGSFIAQKDYVKVLRRLNQLTTDHASVLLCHNDPAQNSDFVKELMAQECPEFEFRSRLEVPDDFSEPDVERSCKVLIYQRI